MFDYPSNLRRRRVLGADSSDVPGDDPNLYSDDTDPNDAQDTTQPPMGLNVQPQPVEATGQRRDWRRMGKNVLSDAWSGGQGGLIGAGIRALWPGI